MMTSHSCRSALTQTRVAKHTVFQSRLARTTSNLGDWRVRVPSAEVVEQSDIVTHGHTRAHTHAHLPCPKTEKGRSRSDGSCNEFPCRQTKPDRAGSTRTPNKFKHFRHGPNGRNSARSKRKPSSLKTHNPLQKRPRGRAGGSPISPGSRGNPGPAGPSRTVATTPAPRPHQARPIGLAWAREGPVSPAFARCCRVSRDASPWSGELRRTGRASRHSGRGPALQNK
jgi:hypothetical protein